MSKFKHEMEQKIKEIAKTIYRFFWPEITYAWCLTLAMGNTHWFVEYKKCRNGTPEGAGWFIYMVKLGPKTTEAEANEAAEELNEFAKRDR